MLALLIRVPVNTSDPSASIIVGLITLFWIVRIAIWLRNRG